MGGTTLKYVTYFYSRTTALLVSKDKVNPFMEVFTDIFALQSLPILLDKNFSRPLQTTKISMSDVHIKTCHLL
jgi:hypothetical protein